MVVSFPMYCSPTLETVVFLSQCLTCCQMVCVWFLTPLMFHQIQRTSSPYMLGFGVGWLGSIYDLLYCHGWIHFLSTNNHFQQNPFLISGKQWHTLLNFWPKLYLVSSCRTHFHIFWIFLMVCNYLTMVNRFLLTLLPIPPSASRLPPEELADWNSLSCLLWYLLSLPKSPHLNFTNHSQHMLVHTIL